MNQCSTSILGTLGMLGREHKYATDRLYIHANNIANHNTCGPDGCPTTARCALRIGDRQRVVDTGQEIDRYAEAVNFTRARKDIEDVLALTKASIELGERECELLKP